ncbi:MAG: hypothetical protein KKF74_01405 [Nanoarchaeota archaeon]|nr:hypothetical protein [Nanoarchaeota archaeon]
MVTIEDLNNKYEPIKKLKDDAYFNASKMIIDYVTNGTGRKWSELAEPQKLEAAEKFTGGVNNAALNLGGVTIGNEYGQELVGNPAGFTEQHEKAIAGDPVNGINAVYKQGIGSIVNKLSNVIPKMVSDSDIIPLKTEFSRLLNFDSSKVTTTGHIARLWDINYNRISYGESLDEQLADFR